MPVLDYEGLYEVSDLGRVKSLERKRIMPNGGIRTYFEKIMVPAKRNGYLKVDLTYKGISKSYSIHRLVYESFNGKTELQVDHINSNKHDNKLSNLQCLTQRENTIKYFLEINKSSNYIGISWHKKVKKWVAKITINGKRVHLGCFDNEKDAADCYQKSLLSIKHIAELPNN